MKYFASIYIISVLLFYSCALISDNTISGTAENTYTGEPVENLPINFHSVSGGGYWGGSLEKNKYSVKSGVGGKFSFEAEEGDLKNKFSPELQDIRNASLNEYDSMAPLWNFLIVHKIGIYRDSDKNHIVKLRPAGVVNLYHPWVDDRTYTTDTIIVSAYHQKDTLTIENGYGQLYFPQRTTQEYSVEYILENNERKLFESSIYIPTVFKPHITGQTSGTFFEYVPIEIPKW